MSAVEDTSSVPAPSAMALSAGAPADGPQAYDLTPLVASLLMPRPGYFGAGYYRWSPYAPIGTAMVLTYSFAETIPADSDLTGLQPVSEAARANIRLAFKAWADISGLSFIEVPDTAGGDVRIGLYDLDPGIAGQAHLPYVLDNGFAPGYAGDVAISSQYAGSSFEPGSLPFFVALHEIGHAIGLKHPFDTIPTLPPDLDNQDNTVMSYTGGSALPRQPQYLDVAAASYLYGSEAAEQADGVNWTWDAQSLVLTTAGSEAANTLIGINQSDRISGHGGHDAIFGLEGGDVIDGGAGNDTLGGGDGDDRLSGGDGLDTAVFMSLRGFYTLSFAGGQGTVVGPDGNDSLDGVERLRFDDGTLAVDPSDQAFTLYRLYTAALDRAPDRGGLSYWIDYADGGGSLHVIAACFERSAEFQSRYGTLDDSGFIAQLYQNILGRDGDEVGTAYWVDALGHGFGRDSVLLSFADSVENRKLTEAETSGGILFG